MQKLGNSGEDGRNSTVRLLLAIAAAIALAFTIGFSAGGIGDTLPPSNDIVVAQVLSKISINISQLESVTRYNFIKDHYEAARSNVEVFPGEKHYEADLVRWTERLSAVEEEMKL